MLQDMDFYVLEIYLTNVENNCWILIQKQE